MSGSHCQLTYPGDGFLARSLGVKIIQGPQWEAIEGWHSTHVPWLMFHPVVVYESPKTKRFLVLCHAKVDAAPPATMRFCKSGDARANVESRRARVSESILRNGQGNENN